MAALAADLRQPLAARLAVRHVRQRHPPAAAVARVPVRRASCSAGTCDPAAPSARRDRSCLVGGHATSSTTWSRAAATTPSCWRSSRRRAPATAACCTRSARSARRSSRSASLSWLGERFDGTARDHTALAAAGRTTLTLYVLHVLVFRALVDGAGIDRPDRSGHRARRSPWCSGCSRSSLAAWWQRFVGQGPLERWYRRFGGD